MTFSNSHASRGANDAASVAETKLHRVCVQVHTSRTYERTYALRARVRMHAWTHACMHVESSMCACMHAGMYACI